MSVYRIASRYAKSLLDLAVEQNKLERIHEDVNSFQVALKNRDFYLMLKSPVIPAERKRAALKALFADKYDELTLAFLDILARKGREAYLPEVAKEFEVQYKSMKNIVDVILKTAVPIGNEVLDSIQAKLKEGDGAGAEVRIENVVEPGLIGGFVLDYNHLLYDASVSHKLELLKKEFQDNLYVSKVISK